MNNPAMLAQAQAMMAKMSPEDIVRMQEMARKMDPNMMRNMQQQMAANPNMMAQAQQAMSHMTPEQLKQQMSAAASLTPEQMQMQADMHMRMAPPPAAPKGTADTLRASAVPVPPSIISLVDEAERFKANGNKRFAAQDFDGAIAKYESALASLADSGYEGELTAANLATVHALADVYAHRERAAGLLPPVTRICLVNTATCLLKKSAFAAAAQACSKVLARSPGHRKALYNRGKALLGQGELKAAVDDLKGAYNADRSDATVLATLTEAKASLKAATIAAGEAGGVAVTDASAQDESSDDEMPELISAPAAGLAGGSAPAALGGMGPETVEQAQRMMASMTPEQMQAQLEMVAQMDPAVLKSLDPRFKDMTTEQVKAQLDMIKSIKPEQLQQMQQMQQMAGGMGGMGAAGGAAGSGAGLAAGGMPPFSSAMGAPGGMDMNAAAAMMDNLSPEMLESMSKMMGSMDPKAMASMLSTSMGRQVSEEEAKKMQEQLSKVSPETMQRWLGRAARAYKMWCWLKASALLLFTEPRRAAADIVKGTALAQTTALLAATLAALVIGHITSLF